MNTTQRTLWAVSAALLLLLIGCGAGSPGDVSGDAARSAVHAASPSPHQGHASDAAPSDDEATHGGRHRGHLAATPPAGDASDHSVYLLPSTWRDQRGDQVALEELGGRVQVVAMVYTHCSFACPRILGLMKQVEGAMLESGLQDRVGFTLVSLDPARDTPERLAEFARSVHLDEDRWTLLTGTEDDVRALSVLLGVKYRAAADGSVDHSNLITVLDPDGVPVHRLEGLEVDTGSTVRSVRRLLE